MKRTLWCDWSLSAPSAGLYPSSHHLQWVDLQMTAQLWLAVAGGGCHDTVDAAQNRLHSISRHRNLDSPHHPSPSHFFLLLCLLSSHYHHHRPFSPLSIPPPPPPLVLPVPPQTGKEGKSGSGSSSGSSGRTGRCAEACTPPPPPPAVQARRCALLCYLSRTICLWCVRECVFVAMCVCVRVGRCWGSVSWLWRLPHLRIICCCWSCRSYGHGACTHVGGARCMFLCPQLHDPATPSPPSPPPISRD